MPCIIGSSYGGDIETLKRDVLAAVSKQLDEALDGKPNTGLSIRVNLPLDDVATIRVLKTEHMEVV